MGQIHRIRGLRIPVATVISLVAAGLSDEAILEAYPDLEAEDIREVTQSTFVKWALGQQTLTFLSGSICCTLSFSFSSVRSLAIYWLRSLVHPSKFSPGSNQHDRQKTKHSRSLG